MKGVSLRRLDLQGSRVRLQADAAVRRSPNGIVSHRMRNNNEIPHPMELLKRNNQRPNGRWTYSRSTLSKIVAGTTLSTSK
jgi:hypothetical protein